MSGRRKVVTVRRHVLEAWWQGRVTLADAEAICGIVGRAALEAELFRLMEARSDTGDRNATLWLIHNYEHRRGEGGGDE